jgi:hypothetical protein
MGIRKTPDHDDRCVSFGPYLGLISPLLVHCPTWMPFKKRLKISLARLKLTIFLLLAPFTI